MLETLISFGISLLIGLLLGIERERSHPEGEQAIGVRTFVLFAMLGTMAATINQAVFTVPACLFVFGIILLSYYRSTAKSRLHSDIGITTELAAGIVFALGYIVPHFALTSITISGVILLVLLERKRLHVFSRETLDPQEIEALIILVIFILGVLPVLPNRTVDPWGLFNPRMVGMLLAVIAGMQFTAYAAIRLFGHRFGRAISGLLGGFVSSTAVFATLRDSLVDRKLVYITMASAILSVLAMLIEVAVILFIASPTLFINIAWPLFTMLAVGSAIVAMLIFFQKKVSAERFKKPSPLKLSSIFYSAILITTILLFISLTKQFIGTEGTLLVSFLSGLFELHGVTLATALLFIEHHLNIYDASLIIAVAIFASFISKFILLWFLTPRYFAFRLSALLILVLASGGAISALQFFLS